MASNLENLVAAPQDPLGSREEAPLSPSSQTMRVPGNLLGRQCGKGGRGKRGAATFRVALVSSARGRRKQAGDTLPRICEISLSKFCSYRVELCVCGYWLGRMCMCM
jgi:hypothetical protein